jgi:hypothetical protein
LRRPGRAREGEARAGKGGNDAKDNHGLDLATTAVGEKNDDSVISDRRGGGDHNPSGGVNRQGRQRTFHGLEG